MNFEIEAKIKIDSLDELSQRLKDIGADFRYDVVESDIYFADADKMIVKKGCGLRLRRRSIGNDEKYILTYKGPKQGGKYKKRQEVEVSVDNPVEMENMLLAIGCEKKLQFEKKRSFWNLDRCLISLDQLPLLGTFIEVEGPDEQTITEVLNQLGLHGAEHINKGYARLMADELDKAGSQSRCVFFDNNI